MHPPYARNRKKMYNSPFFTVQKVETCTAFHSKKGTGKDFFPARRTFLEFSCQEGGGGGGESLKFPAIQIPPWSSPHFCGSRRQRLPGPTVADGRSRGRRSQQTTVSAADKRAHSAALPGRTSDRHGHVSIVSASRAVQIKI